jgi:hypothetical protein
VHLPEGALARGGLRGLRRALGIRVHVPKGEVPKGEDQPPGELVAKSPDNRVGGGAVGALVVAEHDELEPGAVGPFDMVLGGEGRGELGQAFSSP